MVMEAVLVVLGLGLLWAVMWSLLLTRRVHRLEQGLLDARSEATARLEPLEEIARDHWLAESASLGGQVSAMVGALVETTDQSLAAVARQRDEVAALLAQAERQCVLLRAALAEAPSVVRSATVSGGAAATPARAAVPTAATPAAPALPPAPSREAHQREVRRLAAEGLSPVEIARQTGLGVAEIELMVRLGQPTTLQRSA